MVRNGVSAPGLNDSWTKSWMAVSMPDTIELSWAAELSFPATAGPCTWASSNPLGRWISNTCSTR